MNKFSLLICFIFFLNISNVTSIEDYEKFYDALISITKGMAKTSKAVCSSLLVKKRSSIYPVVKEIIQKYEAGKTINPFNYFIKLYPIVNDCDLYTLSSLSEEIKTEEGIRNAGYSIAENSGSIYNILTEMATSDDKYVQVRKIIAIVYNYYVN